MSKTDTVKYLWVGGMIGMIAASILFGQMQAQVNKLLPPEKRISMIESRMRFHEIKSLHEERFPTSQLRTMWYVLMAISVFLMAVGIIVAIKP
jgi:hypothetical protein